MPGVDGSRGERGDQHAVGAVLVGHPLGEREQRGVDRAPGEVAPVGTAPAHAGDVDDAPPPGAAHVREHRAREAHVADELRAPRLEPLLVVDLVEDGPPHRRRVGGARVVDEDVDGRRSARPRRRRSPRWRRVSGGRSARRARRRPGPRGRRGGRGPPRAVRGRARRRRRGTPPRRAPRPPRGRCRGSRRSRSPPCRRCRAPRAAASPPRPRAAPPRVLHRERRSPGAGGARRLLPRGREGAMAVGEEAAEVAIRGGMVWSPTGARRADLYLSGGRVLAVGGPFRRAATSIDAAGLWVMPGIVDGHVHIPDPIRSDREDFASGRPPPPATGRRSCSSTTTPPRSSTRRRSPASRATSPGASTSTSGSSAPSTPRTSAASERSGRPAPTPSSSSPARSTARRR